MKPQSAISHRQSEIQNRRPKIESRKRLLFLWLLPTSLLATGLPEPGLIMYGVVRNAGNNNVRLTSGILNWTITPPSGSPVTISVPLTDIAGQFSYLARVPFESIVGSATPSPNVLQLTSAITAYWRTNVTLTVNSNIYPVSIASTNLPYFNFSTADRGRTEPVDLVVSAPGLNITVSNISIGSGQRLADGRFQLTVNGAFGQTNTLLASTNLVNWDAIQVFVSTNSPMAIYDPMASNYTLRFYRIGSGSASPAVQLTVATQEPSAVPIQISSKMIPLTLMVSSSHRQSYRIQASTDLVSWITLTNFVAGSGPTYFTDTAGTNYQRRFYRGVSP